MQETDKKRPSFWWVWPLINTVLLIFVLGMHSIDKDITNKKLETIKDNTERIEKIEYHLDKKDSVIVNNYIYLNKDANRYQAK